MSSLCLVVADEIRVLPLRLLEGASDASEGGMLLKDLRDWWHPKGGKVKLGTKEKKSICAGT